MAHQSGAVVLKRVVAKSAKQCGKFGLDRLLDQLARATSNDVGQRVR